MVGLTNQASPQTTLGSSLEKRFMAWEEVNLRDILLYGLWRCGWPPGLREVPRWLKKSTWEIFYSIDFEDVGGLQDWEKSPDDWGSQPERYSTLLTLEMWVASRTERSLQMTASKKTGLNFSQPRELGGGSRAPDETRTMPTLWLQPHKTEHGAQPCCAQTSDLQNYELCCFKPLSLWSFVMHQQKTNVPESFSCQFYFLEL